MITTDPQGEMYDVVDEEDRVVSQATRGECHGKGLLHRTITVVIENDRRELLVVRRSRTKALHPGMWEASVGGHVLAGQAYDAAASRELEEEIGVRTPLTAVKKLRIRVPNEEQWKVVYLGRHNGPFRFDPVETDGFQWMPAEAIQRALGNGSVAFHPIAEAVLRSVFDEHLLDR